MNSNHPTNDDLDVLIKTLWGECRGEPYIGQLAVGCVIRNRVGDSRWPSTYSGVCKQPKQFSCWNKGTPNPNIDHPIYGILAYIAMGIISGKLPDITGGANHYINAYIDSNPTWGKYLIAVTLWPSALTGVHTFYRI